MPRVGPNSSPRLDLEPMLSGPASGLSRQALRPSTSLTWFPDAHRGRPMTTAVPILVGGSAAEGPNARRRDRDEDGPSHRPAASTVDGRHPSHPSNATSTPVRDPD